jgi:hypothetical protein
MTEATICEEFLMMIWFYTSMMELTVQVSTWKKMIQEESGQHFTLIHHLLMADCTQTKTALRGLIGGHFAEHAV